MINIHEKQINKELASFQVFAGLKPPFNNIFNKITNELRNPITNILAALYNIIEGKTLSHAEEELMLIAQKSSLDLLSLTNQIANLDKLNKKEIRIQEESFDLQQFIQNIYYQFEPKAIFKQIHFDYIFLVDKPLFIKTDLNKLSVVVQHLLSNAFDFTPSKGKISIIVDCCFQDKISIAVQDSGMGIHQHDLPNIFDCFFQINPLVGGTGIGLAICKEYVQLIGGQIEVQSEWSKGSLFTILFPFQNGVISSLSTNNSIPFTPSEKKENSWDKEAVNISSDAQHLLIVGGNPGLMFLLRKILAPTYQVSHALDGRNALVILESNLNVDLIISNALMPIMNGFEFLKRIKTSTILCKIPFVLLNVSSRKKDKIDALQLGVDGYLLMPFDSEELLATIENLLNKNVKNKLKNGAKNSFTTTTIEKSYSIPINQKMGEEDLKWLKELKIVIRRQMTNPDLTITQIAFEIGVSSSQLLRKTKHCTGLTPMQLIQELRYIQAHRLLEEKKYNTVKSVAYKVGFRTLKNFSRNFKKRFGKNPSDYF